jgi:ribosomal protein S18 acetylase RimI-like enzyme
MLSLRPGQPDDAPRLSAIAAAAKAHWGYPAEWLAAWRQQLTIEPSLLATAWVRVAERAGVPVGFIAVDDGAGGCEIIHLWVVPAAMGQGVGRALVAAALEHAGERALEVEADPHAAAFYERVGFVRRGRVAAPMPGAADRALVLLAR